MTTTPTELQWLAGPAPHEEMARMHADGRLATLLPEVDCLYGIPQVEQWHPEICTGTHVNMALHVAATLTDRPKIRYAVLVHDLGKGLTLEEDWPKHVDHERSGLVPVADVNARFGVPADWAELALLVCKHHLNIHRADELSPKGWARLFENLGVAGRPELLEDLLLAVECDKRGRLGHFDSTYPQAALVRAVYTAVEQVPAAEPTDSMHPDYDKAQEAFWADKVRAVKRALREFRTA